MDAELFVRFGEVESRHWWFLARRDILLGIAARYAQPGARLLDVGCGTGFFLDRARERFNVIGVDPSPIALAMCAARNLPSVRNGTASDLSTVADERFELVTLLDVIEHLDDDVSALRAARAVLVPTGRVIVTVPAFQLLWTVHDEANHHRRRYTKRTLRRALELGGFKVEHITYFNSYLFVFALVERLTKKLLRARRDAELSLPPAPMNRAMRTIFAAEGRRLERGLGFFAGLSVLAVGSLAADQHCGSPDERLHPDPP